MVVRAGSQMEGASLQLIPFRSSKRLQNHEEKDAKSKELQEFEVCYLESGFSKASEIQW